MRGIRSGLGVILERLPALSWIASSLRSSQ